MPSPVFWRQHSWPPVVRILKHSLPAGGEERFGSTLKEHRLERLVMALWTPAAAHASHTQQLSSAQDLAEVPHVALNIPGNPNASGCAVQHRDSQGSFAPQETSSITGCNVKHKIAMLHRRCAHVYHIFQDTSSKRLSKACSLHLNSSQILTQVNFSSKVPKKPLYGQYHVGHRHLRFAEHKCDRKVQFLLLIKSPHAVLGYRKSLICQQ